MPGQAQTNARLGYINNLRSTMIVRVVAFQPAFFTQYIVLFALGILAYRNNWLVSLPRRLG